MKIRFAERRTMVADSPNLQGAIPRTFHKTLARRFAGPGIFGFAALIICPHAQPQGTTPLAPAKTGIRQQTNGSPLQTSAPAVRNPAADPIVTYDRGLLTIVAKSATLGDILDNVQTRTGAVIEFPMSAHKQYDTVTLGPGPLVSILTALLAKSSFDYAIVGSDREPARVHVLLLERRVSPEMSLAVKTAASPKNPAPVVEPVESSLVEENQRPPLTEDNGVATGESPAMAKDDDPAISTGSKTTPEDPQPKTTGHSKENPRVIVPIKKQ